MEIIAISGVIALLNIITTLVLIFYIRQLFYLGVKFLPDRAEGESFDANKVADDLLKCFEKYGYGGPPKPQAKYSAETPKHKPIVMDDEKAFQLEQKERSQRKPTY